MSPPALCSEIAQTPKDIIRLSWTATVIATAASITTAIFYNLALHLYYRAAANHYAAMAMDYDDYNNNDASNSGSADEEEDDAQTYAYYTYNFSTFESKGMSFASLYTAGWSVTLTFFGYMVLRHPTSKNLGMLQGMTVMFSNWCLVNAVVFGEFWVNDNLKDEVKDEMDVHRYRIELMSTALSILCLILGVSYIAFAVVLCVYSNLLVIDDDKTGKGDDDNNLSIVGASGPVSMEINGIGMQRPSTPIKGYRGKIRKSSLNRSAGSHHSRGSRSSGSHQSRGPSHPHQSIGLRSHAVCVSALPSDAGFITDVDSYHAYGS
mmetsp:Transcript_39619/g.47622  ORF Transcript_39619/g.47622 Transcript_39619/m.47622 type:complete len:321 (-) Transcript_39619:449-1411(-)